MSYNLPDALTRKIQKFIFVSGIHSQHRFQCLRSGYEFYPIFRNEMKFTITWQFFQFTEGAVALNERK